MRSLANAFHNKSYIMVLTLQQGSLSGTFPRKSKSIQSLNILLLNFLVLKGLKTKRPTFSSYAVYQYSIVKPHQTVPHLYGKFVFAVLVLLGRFYKSGGGGSGKFMKQKPKSTLLRI